jgi:putative transposase
VIDGWVLLPDHMHCVWTLPQGDDDFSIRRSLIKALFSRETKRRYHISEWMSDSKLKQRETTIWQRRFWEHQIRDEEDLRAHIDYIHFNPAKHGRVSHVSDWPFSTFHRSVRLGIYPQDWGGEVQGSVQGDFGE